ncbi:hypothetical protein QBC42DRAFT_294264 [Cladorrhinum samala]|uniref:Autophagy-related protein 6 n=1 Tax=Cladorrhinum samala TaxID=585594 RepID=A0AAV9HX38_9PEZI|nr:hypothetical protein QBC42DRAFT_294264 [Cladorrhinum samala]
MGWFNGWFGPSDNNPSSSDPLGRLDPKLREFLERESPLKYNTPTLPEPQRPRPKQQPQQSQSQSQNDQSQQQQQQQPPLVPAESLYPDGRYAHIWKTYKSKSSIDAETKSDHEKLMDVLDAFKERKALIGRAALENCAEEQFTWSDCMKAGGWSAKMTMCRAEVQKFERCYSAQSRLLKALGYLSAVGRDPALDEEIQMRADELYHRMVEQEREIEKAKAEGREAPPFEPVFRKLEPVAARDAKVKVPAPSEETVQSWKEKLEKLPEEDRAAEEEALKAEHKANAEMAARIHGLWQEQAKEREERRKKGEATVFDKFKGYLGGYRETPNK